LFAIERAKKLADRTHFGLYLFVGERVKFPLPVFFFHLLTSLLLQLE
jgi:hypothetical protein